MNIIVIQISNGIWVKLLIKSAAPFAKVAATRIPVIIIRTETNFSRPDPKYFETMAGIVRPSSLTDMNPAKKSWMHPIKIAPRVIHINAAGPNNAPCMAPKIGPNPAIFRKLIKKFLVLDRGI